MAMGVAFFLLYFDALGEEYSLIPRPASEMILYIHPKYDLHSIILKSRSALSRDEDLCWTR